MTRDANIFMDLALKHDWEYHELNGGEIVAEEYSRILIVYDTESAKLNYTRNLLLSCNCSDKYKFMRLDEFMDAYEIHDSDLIVPVIADSRKHEKFMDYLWNNNIFFTHDVFCGTLYSTRTDLQYFDVFKPVDDEIVIDAGCYDGATAIQFMNWAGDKLKHIYSFEFDPASAKRCEENLEPYSDKVTLIKKGTWYKDETMYLISGKRAGTGNSSFTNSGSIEVQLTSIDKVVKDERVTFIKMDVEGSELKSLMGARNTIEKNHPRLAICVYHKVEDIAEIPGYILSLVPEYKFYVRHYCSVEWETILYAYCE